MNIVQVINIANLKYGDNIITDKVGRKKINNMIEVFGEICNDTNSDILLNEESKKFYNVFLRPALNNEKEVNPYTYVFFSAVLVILVEEGVEFSDFRKTTFHQKEYLNKLEKINDVFMDLLIMYKENEYRLYSDNYYKKIRKKNNENNMHKKLTEREWNKDIIEKWTKSSQYIFIYDESYELWLNQLEKKFKEKYIRFRFDNKEIDICINFDKILKAIIDNFRVEDKYEESERLLDEICDNIFKLPKEKQKIILNIYSNKIKNLHIEIMNTVEELKEDEKIFFDLMKPRRLSADETSKVYIKEIEDIFSEE
ncbi:hypothetical protein [uncultured Clostridium sp.]|uniref:hypothetical protein n=1 Tax=uncultured Clostridium sp. TaxID=59620 RepID=UPI0025F6ED9D|nr:hypothetical protein [uncultured Clostridium sp.]